MGVCSVIGCQSRSSDSTGVGKHFFRFPKENIKNNKIRENWIKFTKLQDFNPKDSSAICAKHFTPESFVVKKKGRLYLVKDSVPTIYEKCRGNKIEKIQILYNPETQDYINIDDVTITQDLAERERQMIADRDQKVLEAKSLCRFCLESDKDIKCVSISKLEAFLKDSPDSLNFLDFHMQFHELMSEIVCEKCFQVIVDFDAFKKRCQKAQNDFVLEIQEIDEKIQETKNSRNEENIWMKQERRNESAIDEIIADEVEINFDLIEEHLEEEVYDENVYETYAIEEPSDNDVDMIEEEEIDESSIKIDHEEIFDEKDRYEVVDRNVIIENPLRNTAPHRIYECFFCKLKFAGQKTYKAHDCQVKEIKCEVQGCHKMFTKQSGYNQHIVKIHGHMKLSKHFCAICRQVINATEEQFKQHRKLCNRELNFKDQTIECEICEKTCKNLKSYTIHKMFHDSRNIIKSLRESDSPKKSSAPSKGSVICELCGNKFTNSQGLRTHKKNVHLIGSSGEVYQCDICSKVRPSKRSLFNHMRNVHRVQKTPCTVCGKIFRTKALLQKHMMYHDETKRIHFCPLCPDKPGYFTAVALRRHQKSHHIGLRQFSCDFCDASYTSSHMLKQHHRQHHDIGIE